MYKVCSYVDNCSVMLSKLYSYPMYTVNVNKIKLILLR